MSDEQNNQSEEQAGELIDTYTALDQHPKLETAIETQIDLKQSLTKFVSHFLDRIKSHEEIETILKQALVERLPDATIEDITNILNIVMTKTNSAVEKVMIPFSGGGKNGSGGDVTNNFLVGLAQKQPVEDRMLKDKNMTPETMKGLYDLAQLMNTIIQKNKK